jgi:hypothetical protein
MPIFDDADMQDFADLFQDLAARSDFQIKRNAHQDSDYGSKDALVVIAEGKGMRKQPRPYLIQLYSDRLGSLSSWHVSLPLGQDVQEGDIITMEGDDMEVQVLLKDTWSASTDVLASVVK